jgi:hypothetical protein
MTTLVTGTPLGSITTQEGLYVQSSPYIFVQDATANPLKNPDANGFYWNLSGTATYPVYELGCIQDVSLTEGLTMNDVRCDTVGIVDTLQRRDYIEFNFTILSVFPLVVSRHPLNLSVPVAGTGYEITGMGEINNVRKYMVYAPIVYDPDNGDYLAFHLHKAKFVDAWTIDFKSGGEPWAVTGLKLRGYADSTKSAAQRFGVLARGDLSALP